MDSMGYLLTSRTQFWACSPCGSKVSAGVEAVLFAVDDNAREGRVCSKNAQASSSSKHFIAERG